MSKQLLRETPQNDDDLRDLVSRPGPFASVVLATPGGVEDAVTRIEARWKGARSALERMGAPDEVLERIDPTVPDAHQLGDGLAVIAGVDRVLHVEHGSGVDDRVTWGPAPHLLPVLRWRQSEPPYAVVLTDRTGADLFAFRRGAPDLRGEVEGEHNVIRKVQSGGWSQRRYQERAEDSWEHNADQVAERVTKLVDAIDAAVVIVAGDVRAVGLLRDALPDRVRDMTHVVEGERPWDGKGDPLPEETDDVVRREVRAVTDALLERFEEERGQQDQAAEGIADTAAALARSQVAMLLVAEEGGGEESLWVGPEPALVATTEQALRDLGVEGPEQAPARDALVRAALGTGADVRVLDDAAGVRDGVGALLRWAEGGAADARRTATRSRGSRDDGPLRPGRPGPTLSIGR